MFDAGGSGVLPSPPLSFDAKNAVEKVAEMLFQLQG